MLPENGLLAITVEGVDRATSEHNDVRTAKLLTDQNRTGTSEWRPRRAAHPAAPRPDDLEGGKLAASHRNGHPYAPD